MTGKHLKPLLLFMLLFCSSAVFAYEQVTYYHNDALGSPIVASDSEGKILWRESYQPYGERQQREPRANANRRWFTSHVEDADTGLLYMQARYYDPKIGRFMSMDPVGFVATNPMSFNRYLYVNNNPYKYVDPDGRSPDILLSSDPTAYYTMRAEGAGVDSFSYSGASSTASMVSEEAAHQLDFLPLAAIGASLRLSTRFASVTKGGDKLLYRRGARDNSKLLKNQAKAAEESKIGVHGVSVSSSSATSKAGQVVRCASCREIEKAGFKVHKTGRDPNHYTVELPKPVTKDVSQRFNDVFK